MNPSDGDDFDFEARLAALTRDYVRALPDKRAELARLWHACRADAAAPEWGALRQLVHRLSGAAPNYGFEALGEAARALDALLSGASPCRDPLRLAPALAACIVALDAAIGGAS
ncbi:MAG: Hpt domain-containing protein [Mizugakiibacter sp.]|uniref:Hpt domain-containing protein n=1 Tax=Mizugakiibacter sp. TaxID=1972610 RepID=UPI0031BFF480|nr:Hpt domain-containing protein [Xanthomonadaceae bacterium]